MKALVVGLGRMGGFHRRVLMDLGYDVTTVDPDRASGADYRVVPTLLARSLDVVCVAVPISDLAEQAARFAGRHRYLLIEKPMASTAEDARELVSLLDGEPVAVGYVERFNPQVQWLRRQLATDERARAARFTRWNDRPSPDLARDLTSHDIDLARYLSVDHCATYDTADDVAVRVRQVEVTCEARRTYRVNLLAHDTSPLHAQWHAFLGGKAGYATPGDAVAVLAALEAPVAVAA